MDFFFFFWIFFFQTEEKKKTSPPDKKKPKKKKNMYLVVYGADYCPFTRNIWSQLHAMPFVYMPYKPYMDKDQYWKAVKMLLNKTERMTFPTLVLLKDNTAREVFLMKGLLQDANKTAYQPSALSVPQNLDGTVISDKTHLQDAFTKDKVFTYKP